MHTQPALDLNIKFDGLVWPSSAQIVVVYFERSDRGVWLAEPTVTFFETTSQVELFLYDLSTDTYADTGASYIGLVYLKGAQKPTLFRYP